jgi:hypothetical protein
MTKVIRLLVLCGLCAALLMSCSKKNSTGTTPEGPNIPAGVARLSGTVKDASGAVIPNALVHVVYEFASLEPPVAAHPANTAIAYIFYANEPERREPLMTECGGNVPIPDGPMVYLYWDRNSNGADDSDPLLPLCEYPPDCEGSTLGTVNFNETPINGVEQALGAGYFAPAYNLATYGRNLEPNRIFARIFCADGRPLYTSEVITIGDGYGEYQLTFAPCTPCTGAPINPDWHITQGYPNPAIDTVTVEYGLQQPSQPLMTLHWPYSDRIDTLLGGNQPSGVKHIKVVLDSNKPNGLYDIRLDVAGSFTGHQTVLKNVADEAVLRSMKEAAVTDAEGHFTLDASAGMGIDRRSATNSSLGTVTLSRIRVAVVKTGYLLADSTLTVESGLEYGINLTLHAQ